METLSFSHGTINFKSFLLIGDIRIQQWYKSIIDYTKLHNMNKIDRNRFFKKLSLQYINTYAI